jgi:alpha-tubulin suppressor-like RCC1 family protein
MRARLRVSGGLRLVTRCVPPLMLMALLLGALCFRAADAASPSLLAVSTTGGVSCALRSGGTLECWGVNAYGLISRKGLANRVLRPTPITGIAGVKTVDFGANDACVILTGGTVKCWGNDTFGQLGDGRDATVRVSSSVNTPPVLVRGVTNAVAISVHGVAGGCALISGGTVKCWGENAFGNLGDGTVKNSATPVTVKGISNARAIGVGYETSCAVLAGGAVECWGGTDRTGKPTATPVAIGGVTGAVAVSVGGTTTCVLLGDGGVSCWGDNGIGELGNGTNVFRSDTPTLVSGISNAKGISGGGTANTTCALLAGGTVKCWGQILGSNIVGGKIPHTSTPVMVKGINNAIGLSTGNAGSCALLANRQVKCWGDAWGALGYGKLTDSKTPVTVRGL